MPACASLVLGSLKLRFGLWNSRMAAVCGILFYRTLGREYIGNELNQWCQKFNRFVRAIRDALLRGPTGDGGFQP